MRHGHLHVTSIFDRALHIPAERTLFAPTVARHERVLLPLAAGPSARFHGAVALAAFAALACLVLGLEMATREADPGALVFALGFLAASVPPAAIAGVGLRDALRGRPLLVLDPQGLRDTRLDPTPIAWSDVAAAEIVATGSGIQAVRLTLRAPAAARFNPVRIGGWSADWGRRHDTRLVAIMLLDVRAHVLAHTMLALARRHGATVEDEAPEPIWPMAS